jgi:uncharacterized protein (DUF1697 family)
VHIALFPDVHIALFRAVNLAGSRTLGMAALRAMLADLGCTDVKTVLQSGNVVFGCGRGTGVALERWLETATLTQFGLRTDVFVRTPEEWQKLIGANPFPDEAKKDPAHLLLMCLKAKPRAKAIAALRAAITGPERVCAIGRELYVVYPAGIGRSRLTAALIDAKLETRGTARNWNTVLKLGAMTAS